MKPLIPTEQERGWLYAGDNLPLLAALPEASIDLVITDPPFFTKRKHVSPPGPRTLSGAQWREKNASFDDRWPDLEAYLSFLRIRLEAIHRVLQPNGSLVLHLDHRAVHEMKVVLDEIFGRDHFINEIIWHYTGGGRAKRYFSRKHDTLLWYAKGRDWTFHLSEVRQPYNPTSGYARKGIVGRSGKHYRPHPEGTPVDDVWYIPMINPQAAERTGFPTQKPEPLLERLVRGLSSPGDLILDPFCGSGTTVVVAHRLGRRWIAADSSPDAIAVTRRRFAEREGFRAILRDEKALS